MLRFDNDNTILFLLQLIEKKFVKREAGKGLSSNDFTDEEKAKLAALSESAVNLPLYSGKTNVTPETVSQTLETANTIVQEDITIKAVPYAEVSNSSGGETITIGG